MGWATGPHLLGFAVLAVEIEGVSGDDLLDITMAEMVAGDSGSYRTVEHAGREYLTVDGSSALYATNRTFYLINAYCCVEFGPSPGPMPTGEEIVHSLIEGLPLGD